MKPSYLLDWNELAFGKKSVLGKGDKIFIAAPRKLSAKRINQIIKTQLPKADIVFGVSKEEYVGGLEDCSQFQMLSLSDLNPIAEKLSKAKLPHTFHILEYNQRDLIHILQKVSFKKAVFFNGSWYGPFHMKPVYYELVNSKTPYELVSPFIDEQEAQVYADEHRNDSLWHLAYTSVTDAELFDVVTQAARASYDYAAYQTGAVLAKKSSKDYKVLLTSHNVVLPYETYAMHHGSLREKNFAVQNDMNYYDTLHAEMVLLAKALAQKVSLKNCSLFVNLLPCPQCARMLAETDITEVVYGIDHSAGFAVQLLEQCGKSVRRVIQDQ